ncbi:MAG: hypothetical protein M1358_23845 [Chloroflexi bacterium]|nr:hypothetical protein [Chloroflexota bacterium]
MPLDPELIQEVNSRTEVLRPPQQKLATFGTTSVAYYLLTEPVYAEVIEGAEETVVRRGQVSAERPQIVTPYYLLNLFNGFEHGSEFAQYLAQAYGANAPGLLYAYRNDLHETTVVSDPLSVVAGRIVDDLDDRGDRLAAVIQGVDHLWDVSLMKFIYELTSVSVGHNLSELGNLGLLGGDGRLPRAARARLEEMFKATASGDLDPRILKTELDRWGVFEEYEDRFLDLFRRRR